MEGDVGDETHANTFCFWKHAMTRRLSTRKRALWRKDIDEWNPFQNLAVPGFMPLVPTRLAHHVV